MCSNRCLRCRSTHKPVPNCGSIYSEELLTAKDTSKSMQFFHINLPLLKSKTNFTKLTSPLSISPCRPRLCLVLQSLSFPFPLQIFVGLTSNSFGGGFFVFFFSFYPSFLHLGHLLPPSYSSLPALLNWQLQSSSHDSMSRVICFLSLGDREGGVTEFFGNDLSQHSGGASFICLAAYGLTPTVACRLLYYVIFPTCILCTFS